MNIYEFMDDCRKHGLDADEAECKWYEYCDDKQRAFEEEYYSRPDVCAGWAQQDIIDMYRRER